MKHIYDDGGRANAGYRGTAGDCVVRAVAIATEQPYRQVYEALAGVNASTRRRGVAGKRSARNGVRTSGVAFQRYMESLGWQWVPCMGIGTGCRVHLHDGELPSGRLVVRLSKHLTAVIDGVIHDTWDPQRESHSFRPDDGGDLKPGEARNINGIWHVSRRCVYGYWRATDPLDDALDAADGDLDL
jgi:hypothetical protein